MQEQHNNTLSQSDCSAKGVKGACTRLPHSLPWPPSVALFLQEDLLHKVLEPLGIITGVHCTDGSLAAHNSLQVAFHALPEVVVGQDVNNPKVKHDIFCDHRSWAPMVLENRKRRKPRGIYSEDCHETAVPGCLASTIDRTGVMIGHLMLNYYTEDAMSIGMTGLVFHCAATEKKEDSPERAATLEQTPQSTICCASRCIT